MNVLVKWVQNNIVTVMIGLPNLTINFAVQTVLDVGFHWSGWYAPLAYLIGTGCSVQYSVIFSMLTRSNFRVGKWEYRFHHEDRRED